MTQRGTVQIIASHRNRACWVVFAHVIDHGLQPVKPIIDVVLYIAHFVPNAPDKYTWVIAIALYKVLDVALGEFFKIGSFQNVGLFIILVKSLVENKHPHLVAQFVKLGSRHVVTGTNGIATHRLHNFNLALHGTHIKRTAEQTLIMM